MSCDVGEATEELENELYLRHSSFSNPSVASPTSQIILKSFRRFNYVTDHLLPFRCFTCVTVYSPTLLSLLLRHKILTLFTWRAAHKTPGGNEILTWDPSTCE